MKLIHPHWLGALALVSLASWAQSAGPTDPQIAAIVVMANQVDIDAGKLAESRSKSSDVKAFAQQMVTDHAKQAPQATPADITPCHGRSNNCGVAPVKLTHYISSQASAICPSGRKPQAHSRRPG